MKNRTDPDGTVTRLIQAARAGEPGAEDQLFYRVEGELRRAAQSLLTSKGVGIDVLRGTELVNMACVRLLGRDQPCVEDRAHFFFLLGRAMHDVFVEEARRHATVKRGHGRRREMLVELADQSSTRIAATDLRDGMDALRATDPDAARAVELHQLAGRSLRETAELMGVTLHRVRQHVEYGMAWLRERLDARE